MSQYSVLVSGENYLLITQDVATPQKLGFLVWRCVEARTQAEAEQCAIQRVQTDVPLSRAGRNLPGDPPRLRVEETRVGWGNLTPPGSGFIFISEQETEPPRTWLGKMGAWLCGWRKVQIQEVRLPEE